MNMFMSSVQTRPELRDSVLFFILMQGNKVLICMLVSIFLFCLLGCASQDLTQQERAAQKKAQQALLDQDKVHDLEKARRIEVQKKIFLFRNSSAE